MPSYVIYARKSSESEDRQVLSIDSQIQELKLLAARRGMVVDEILVESRSAKEPGRPIFGELMRRVHKKTIAGILCWKIDRLARNHFDTGQVLQALADGSLPAVITPERTYTEKGDDRLLGNFEFGMATKYIDDLRANVKRGNRERLRRGWPNFRPPQGYLEDHAAKTIIKDTLRFPLVRRMWNLLLSGRMRPSQILVTANVAWGYRTRKTARQGGKPLSLTGLYGIFSNPFYMGLIPVKGELNKGAYEPMITPQEFEQAQEILGRPGRARPVRHEFPYAGLLRCDRCGGAVVGEEHVKRSGTRYVYYRCHGRRKQDPCSEPSLPEKQFDQQLLSELARMTLPPRSMHWIRRVLEKTISADLEQRHAARRSVEQALDQAVREDDTLLTVRLRGQVDDDTFEKRRKEIQERRARLQLQLEQPDARPEELMKLLDQALAFPQIAQDIVRQGDVVGRRQILQAIGSNWRVRDRKALYIANKPFSLFKEATASSLWWAVAEDVRTWLLENSQGFSLPKLGGTASDDTMTREATAA